jgi:hypothetical protein
VAISFPFVCRKHNGLLNRNNPSRGRSGGRSR